MACSPPALSARCCLRALHISVCPTIRIQKKLKFLVLLGENNGRGIFFTSLAVALVCWPSFRPFDRGYCFWPLLHPFLQAGSTEEREGCCTTALSSLWPSHKSRVVLLRASRRQVAPTRLSVPGSSANREIKGNMLNILLKIVNLQAFLTIPLWDERKQLAGGAGGRGEMSDFTV